MTQTMRRRLPLLLALWAAFALRLFQLDAQSIWWDEGISLHLGTSSLLDIAQNRAANIHPPLYFWSLKGWLALVGVGAFHGRFLSVLASLLQVAALYAVARRWFGPGRTTWLALALIITAPISILYGQEIRAYALLPVVYFLLFGLTQQIIREQGRRRPPLLALALVEWTGLHLHYIVVFLVIYLNGWVLAHWLAGRRRTFALRPWLLAQTAVFLASLPWAAAVLWRWNAVQAEANAGTYLTDPAPIPFLLSQVGVFHLTGLPSVLSQPLVRWLAAAALALFLLLLAARLAQPATRRPAAALLLHWLLPLSMAVVVWSIRSFSHPRYILMYTVGLVPLLAYLIWPPRAVSRKPYSVFRIPYSVFRIPY
ncbi:MAG: glycosyltransferase family 39 protein, partial [Anaerolineales bacterium]|nr:glycosyltransferase family 39 protein [Anaerolineales bacterium]